MRTLLLVLMASLTLCATSPGEGLGLQLWSLRQDLAADPGKGLDEVKALGLTAVETHSTYGLTPAQFRRLLDVRGLKAASAHFPYERFDRDLAGVIVEAKVLGASYVILPWLPQERFDEAAARDLAAHLNTWGARLRLAGLKLGYHPHGFEFVPLSSGGTVFDLLVGATHPDEVCFELDVFWAAHAGANPVALLSRYPDRFKLLHVKDLRRGAAITPTRSAPEADNVAVGQGQIDWQKLLGVAERIGVEYYFLEDETSAPKANLPISMAFIKAFKP